MIKLIRYWILKRNFKIACRKADRLQQKNFKKHLVYKMAGKFVIVERQELKRLHLAGKFKRGLNVREVEAAALYTTKLL